MAAFWRAVWRDLPELGLVIAVLLGLMGVSEVLRRLGMSAEVSRHLVHAGVGLTVAATPWVFETAHPVYVLGSVFVVANGIAWLRGWVPGLHAARSDSVGTITFPLVLLPALAIGWSLDPGRVWAFQTSFVLLAICDPLAAWVGTHMNEPGPYRIGAHTKSWAGSAAFFFSAMALTAILLLAFRAEGVLDWSAGDVVVLGVVVAGTTAAVEALGHRGWDNLTIVLATLLTLLHAHEHPDVRGWMGGALLAGIGFGVVAYRARALDRSGAVAGGLLAWTLLSMDGWGWAIPGLTFFVLSSVLSRVGRSSKEQVRSLVQKPDARDGAQVLANGGVAWLLLMGYVAVPADIWYVGFLGAFAAATADTWATELGALARRRPFLVTTGRRVPPGTSGAISGMGTLAAMAGASVLALSAGPFLAGFMPSGSVGWALLAIGGSGFAGSLVDSFLGATVQAQFVDPASGRATERIPEGVDAASPQRGWSWLRNDQVNGLCTATGAALAMACFPWL